MSNEHRDEFKEFVKKHTAEIFGAKGLYRTKSLHSVEGLLTYKSGEVVLYTDLHNFSFIGFNSCVETFVNTGMVISTDEVTALFDIGEDRVELLRQIVSSCFVSKGNYAYNRIDVTFDSKAIIKLINGESIEGYKCVVKLWAFRKNGDYLNVLPSFFSKEYLLQDVLKYVFMEDKFVPVSEVSNFEFRNSHSVKHDIVSFYKDIWEQKKW